MQSIREKLSLRKPNSDTDQMFNEAMRKNVFTMIKFVILAFMLPALLFVWKSAAGASSRKTALFAFILMFILFIAFITSLMIITGRNRRYE